VEPESARGEIRQGAVFAPVTSERGRWDRFYPDFARAVRGEAPLAVDPSSAVVVLEVLDAMVVSANENRVVDL
jgi:predicted dehydrogenase